MSNDPEEDFQGGGLQRERIHLVPRRGEDVKWYQWPAAVAILLWTLLFGRKGSFD